MDAVSLDLCPQPAALESRFLQRIIILLLGVVNLVLAIYVRGGFRYVNLTAGLAILAFSVAYRKIYRPRVVQFGREEIVGLLIDSQESRLSWEDVQCIEATKNHLKIYGKNGQKVNLNLDNITLHQEREVLPKVLELASLKGVKVSVGNGPLTIHEAEVT